MCNSQSLEFKYCKGIILFFTASCLLLTETALSDDGIRMGTSSVGLVGKAQLLNGLVLPHLVLLFNYQALV